MLNKNVNLSGKTVLVTGAAGFIGAALCHRLLSEYPELHVVGLDSMNDYYDLSLKEWRLTQLQDKRFSFVCGGIADADIIHSLFQDHHFHVVVNLAAQAGVRYSIENPDAYIRSNLIGFYNILEACRAFPVEHLVYASSSSVYGTNAKIPILQMIKWIIRSVCMPLQKKVMSLWLTLTQSSTTFHVPACVFLQYTVLLAGLTWHTSVLQTN